MKAKRTHLRLMNDLTVGGRMPAVFPVPASSLTVTFDSHPASFLVTKAVCCAAGCPCRELLLDFEELGPDGKPLPRGLAFLLSLNVDRFVDRPGEERRPPAAFPLIEEFVRDLTPEDRATARGEFLNTREAVRNAARFLRTCEPEKNGDLVSGEQTFASRNCQLVLNDRRTIELLDAYCPNPECNCRDVILKVLGAPYGSAANDIGAKPVHLFTFRWDFAKSYKIDEPGALSESAAADLCQTMFKDEQIPAWAEIWEWRSRVVKGFRKQFLTLKKTGSPAMPPPPDLAGSSEAFPPPQRIAPSRPGPNQPCSCGSGRKYKKCCGRRG